MEKRWKKKSKERERGGKRAGDKSEKEVGPRRETEVEREKGTKWVNGEEEKRKSKEREREREREKMK